jgi:hypothetical protein
MSWRFLLPASLAWIFTIAVGMLIFFRSYSFPDLIPANSPEGTAAITYAEYPRGDERFTSEYTTPVTLDTIIVTWLKITYDQRIDTSVPEVVTAEVFQGKYPSLLYLQGRSVGYPEPLSVLRNSVKMSLQSAAFDFGNDDGARFLPSGTKGTVQLRWNMVPRQAGQAALNLRLKDVHNANVVINGENKSFKGNDDIPLTVDVRTKYGLTPFLQGWMLWLATAISFVVSSFLTWKGTRSRRVSLNATRKGEAAVDH